MKKILSVSVLLAGVFLALSSFCVCAEEYEIVMVAKHEGISWFDDMRTGVEEFGKDHADVKAYQIAPEGGDPAKQVQMVEDLIAKGVDAILVVPNDPTSMEPVLKKAKEAGIIVISHEAQQLAGIVDYDMESFVNEDFGRLMMESLAAELNGEGEYTGFVGALTMQTHMQWFNAAVELQKEKFPNMKLVTAEPIEDKNNEKLAYDRATELIKTYPNLKGIIGCSVSSTTMSALVLEEKENKDIAVAGLALPSVSGPYIKSGYLKKGQCWRPADAGYVSALIAYKMLKGEEISTGINLVKPGYENCAVKDGVVFGNAPLVLTAENVDQYPF
ncbi:MAG: autoinducer 2 ABC transporter substrate-binding protein [Candidatus Vecturithrix sp.]|jgi:simple sugar transport system substrate-binding protein|nr:autoinducer 2 ABC transporter substrate-binding protein [Candidatus Vecturithrix sp.]